MSNARSQTCAGNGETHYPEQVILKNAKEFLVYGEDGMEYHSPDDRRSRQ
jgi:hypothetical protein